MRVEASFVSSCVAVLALHGRAVLPRHSLAGDGCRLVRRQCHAMQCNSMQGHRCGSRQLRSHEHRSLCANQCRPCCVQPTRPPMYAAATQRRNTQLTDMQHATPNMQQTSCSTHHAADIMHHAFPRLPANAICGVRAIGRAASRCRCASRKTNCCGRCIVAYDALCHCRPAWRCGGVDCTTCPQRFFCANGKRRRSCAGSARRYRRYVRMPSQQSTSTMRVACSLCLSGACARTAVHASPLGLGSLSEADV